MTVNEGFTCPACKKPLETVTINDAEVEACTEGCGGIWFDSAELFRLDQQGEGDADPVLEELFSLPSPQKSATPEKRTCIKCGNKMKAHEYRESSGIIIDECYACGGIWLDGGELKAIRTNPAVLLSNQERDKLSKDFSQKVQDENKKIAESRLGRLSKKPL